MIPKAKKNLHACKYHLSNLLQSRHFEEVEINFAAFVNSARNTTFVLQKEFKGNSKFIEWYGDSKKEKVTCVHCGKAKKIPYEPREKTKQHEMQNDELCKFFLVIRSQIVKEGINNLHCSTKFRSSNATKDFPDKPIGAALVIGPKGVYYHVYKGTAKEDNIPAISKTAQVITDIFVAYAPTRHLGKTISNPNLLTISQLYYKYLENLVEEWTEIVTPQ